MKTIDLSVIDQMFAAIVAANENDATINALRPQVEQAVRELIRQRGLPKASAKPSNSSTPTPSPSSMDSP